MIREKQLLPAGLALAEERGDESRFGYRLPGGTGLVGRYETKSTRGQPRLSAGRAGPPCRRLTNP